LIISSLNVAAVYDRRILCLLQSTVSGGDNTPKIRNPDAEPLI
jgi:hypothetical protein